MYQRYTFHEIITGNNRNEIPEIYLKIWQSVQCNVVVGDGDAEFCDRDRLYQILITSNLSNDILAKLWSFVNRTKPGELTRNELFVLLALVSLVQQNVTNPLQELYSIQTIPVPRFSGLSSSMAITEPIKPDENKFSESSYGENEFCEFKSAPTTTTTTIDDKQENEIISNIFVEPQQDSTINPTDSIITDEDLLFELSTTTSQEQTQLTNNNEDDDDFGDFIQTKIFNVNDPTDKDFDDQEDFSAYPDVQPDEQEEEEKESNDDKYSFFRKFQNELSVQEEFGDFHSQTIEQQKCSNNDDNINTETMFKPDGKNRINEKILTAIKQVMHKTFNVLAVYKIAERIKSTIKHDDDDKCRTLVDEIDRNWNSIHNLMKKASIILNDDNDSKEFQQNEEGGDDEKCWICSTRIIFPNENDNEQDETITNDSLRMAVDDGGGNDIQYHLTCANFWLNFVNTTLPHFQT
ncbi:hypothetical protein BLA29_002532 [Euroglyphus maynei]|uniref:EH domain-containing protein n=1 Tax=Euroglyphus maynei TaxID=6958 RepID=A0A1Y3BNQ8_EURMA|nr:hypothetical protein BLA29_002532 [Euroglyphus maynei]